MIAILLQLAIAALVVFFGLILAVLEVTHGKGGAAAIGWIVAALALAKVIAPGIEDCAALIDALNRKP